MHRDIGVDLVKGSTPIAMSSARVAYPISLRVVPTKGRSRADSGIDEGE